MSLSAGIQNTFAGARVAAFESRQAEAMSSLIAKCGGAPVSAPSMQEVPLGKNPEVARFADMLFKGQIPLIVLMTGVGTRFLLEALSVQFDREEVIAAFSKSTLVARGPKSVKALKEAGLTPDIMVPEPNTWRELLEVLETSEKSVDLNGIKIAVQEYGESNTEFYEALKKKGAHVIPVPVYRWALPDDTSALSSAIQEIIAGQIGFAFFTSAAQIKHLIQFASQQGVEDSLRAALHKVVIGSIGPTTTETLEEYGFSADFTPSHSKMGLMVTECAERAAELIHKKKTGSGLSIQLMDPSSAEPEGRQLRRQTPFMKACFRESVPYTPVWLMRQAGRYMKEYAEVRSRVSFKDLCKKKELAAEVTVVAQQKLGVDAAIIFSDILLVLESMGLLLEYTKGDGPQLSEGIETHKDVDRLKEIDPREDLSYVMDAIHLTRANLAADIPLIGFCGAPFTLASYAIEGGGSKTFLKTKQFMYANPEAWHRLLEKISKILVQFLNAQISAGSDAVQIFDSWVGCLGGEDYRQFVLPHMKYIISNVTPGVPVIHFGTGTGPIFKDMASAGGHVLGVDFKTNLDEAWSDIHYRMAVQGNLDPSILFADFDFIRTRTKQILDSVGSRPGHIFNLGHGILPGTPVDHVIRLVEFVHDYTKKIRTQP